MAKMLLVSVQIVMAALLILITTIPLSGGASESTPLLRPKRATRGIPSSCSLRHEIRDEVAVNSFHEADFFPDYVQKNELDAKIREHANAQGKNLMKILAEGSREEIKKFKENPIPNYLEAECQNWIKGRRALLQSPALKKLNGEPWVLIPEKSPLHPIFNAVILRAAKSCKINDGALRDKSCFCSDAVFFTSKRTEYLAAVKKHNLENLNISIITSDDSDGGKEFLHWTLQPGALGTLECEMKK